MTKVTKKPVTQKTLPALKGPAAKLAPVTPPVPRQPRVARPRKVGVVVAELPPMAASVPAPDAEPEVVFRATPPVAPAHHAPAPVDENAEVLPPSGQCWDRPQAG